MLKCLHCGKKLEEGRRKYCSTECCKRKYYLDNKDYYIQYRKEWEKNHPKRAKEIHRKACKKYFKKYPEKICRLVMKYQNKFKYRCKERMYAYHRRKAILDIIGYKCVLCCAPVEIVHHIKYTSLPHDNLKKYCKYLMPLCRECHTDVHWNSEQL